MSLFEIERRSSHPLVDVVESRLKTGGADDVMRELALDQTTILSDYLRQTPPDALDMEFVIEHADALVNFAREAKKSAGRNQGKVDEP